MKIRRSAYGAALTAMLVTGGLVAGCGGDDKSSTTKPLSQSEFVAKATATYTFAPIDADTIAFQSVERSVDGKALPDTKELKMKRVQ